MELFAFCRTGFEKETAAELNQILSACGIVGYVNAKQDSGFVRYISEDCDGLLALISGSAFYECIFVRHWCITDGVISGLPVDDRATPLVRAAINLLGVCSIPEADQVVALTIDTNEGKSLGRLAKGVARHMAAAVPKGRSQWRLQLTFITGDTAVIGLYRADKVSVWEGGIPRLRVPKSAPSRATLKLEEAWHHFVPQSEWGERLAPSMTAVDLGAAPGGWTWQLVNKSMFVTAVDNGPMADSLMESGQVTHAQEDGFVYTPSKPVDWLVCDIADKPAKVAALIARWGENRWFKEAVFNLKLPMKQRYVAVRNATTAISERLLALGIDYELGFKQLYHDREEVTGHLRLLYP